MIFVSLFIIACCMLFVVDARPVVRSIRSAHEFDRLLQKHSTETGLPVVVDFYSDGCGPCRMVSHCLFFHPPPTHTHTHTHAPIPDTFSLCSLIALCHGHFLFHAHKIYEDGSYFQKGCQGNDGQSRICED